MKSILLLFSILSFNISFGAAKVGSDKKIIQLPSRKVLKQLIQDAHLKEHCDILTLADRKTSPEGLAHLLYLERYRYFNYIDKQIGADPGIKDVIKFHSEEFLQEFLTRVLADNAEAQAEALSAWKEITTNQRPEDSVSIISLPEENVLSEIFETTKLEDFNRRTKLIKKLKGRTGMPSLGLANVLTLAQHDYAKDIEKQSDFKHIMQQIPELIRKLAAEDDVAYVRTLIGWKNNCSIFD